MPVGKAINTYYENIYRLVRLIPSGRITTYGAIARFLGSPQASRRVGYALNLSRHQLAYVPAHRVVNRNGMLTGKHHFGGPGVMQELLEGEGVKVENDYVTGFNKLFWDPFKELDGDAFFEKSKPQRR